MAPSRLRKAGSPALLALALLLMPLAGSVPDALAQGGRTVRVGSEAPAFTLPTLAGGTLSLADYRSEKSVVVIFYRGWVGYW